MKKQRINKYGEKLYPVRLAELDTNTKMTAWWTMAQCEFADYLARHNGFCYIDGFGYFYYFDKLKTAMEKAFENPYWLKKLSTS